MGWWSANILGGDTPYDAHAWVWDRCFELIEDPDRDYGWTLDQKWSPFDHNRKELRDILTLENIRVLVLELDELKHDRDVYAQVLALMILESGSPMPPEVRKRLLELCADDEWAQEDEERALYVLDLCRRIQTYSDGEIHDIPTKGLMSKLSEQILGVPAQPMAVALRPEDQAAPQQKLKELLNA
jgi:hypothetical protein